MAPTNQSLLIILLFTLLFYSSHSKALNTTYYSVTCPSFSKIMADIVTDKQIKSPSTAAATLRLFFHDCILNGCDASVLISSTHFNKAERDADINLSLPGDGFDVVVRAKTALELECPRTVSCADILAVATRDLIVMVGGPFYEVKLGRRDGPISIASSVEGNLPRPTMTIDQIVKLFGSRGFTVQETVALSGAHTIGFSHCKEFSRSIFNYSKVSAFDPHYNPRFADGLRSACGGMGENPTLSVFNDIMTPNKFDNMYFKNLPKGLGLLASDHGLADDPRTKPFVQMYGADEDAFFKAFGRAMVKLSVYGVKTGRNGEIRRRCDQVN